MFFWDVRRLRGDLGTARRPEREGLKYVLAVSLALGVLVGSVAPPLAAQSPRGAPPPELLGEFLDDYGNRFRISDSAFVQLPGSRYRVVEWNTTERYLIAQNDAANPGDPGLWTRIDWMSFSGMAPYTWGFCLTAYRAPSEDSARATPPADRAVPRTGCNGFPFSRMRRPDTPPRPPGR